MRPIHLLKWGSFILIVGLIIYFPSPAAAFASSSKSESSSEPLPYSAHELLIQFNKNIHIELSSDIANTGYVPLDSLNLVFNVKSILPFSTLPVYRQDKTTHLLSNTYLFIFEEEHDLLVLLKSFQDIDVVELAEPNFFYFSDTAKSIQTSTLEQRNIEQVAQRNKQGKPVIIGIIDTGIDQKNSDLAGRLWHNSLEKPDGKDNDLNGFPDDLFGWDFTTQGLTQTEQDNSFGHGTFIAKTISGLFPKSNESSDATLGLMILKAGALTQNGLIQFSTFDVSRAIIYAAENGADVLNLSWYSEHPSEILRQAIAHARSKGCSIISAAGSTDSDAPTYPASFDDVWAVTAVDDNDQIFPGANHGDWVDVAAPGFGPFFTSEKDTIISNITGTSVAAAYVSALAARLLCCEEINPGDSLKHRILWSCENIYKKNPNHEGKLGAGRINVTRALNAMYRPNVVVQNVSIEKRFQSGSMVTSEMYAVKINLKNCSAAAEDIKVTMVSENPGITILNPQIQISKLDYQQEFDNDLNPFLIVPEADFRDEPTITLSINAEAANDYKFNKDISIQTELKPPKYLTIQIKRPALLSWATSERFVLYNIYRKAGHENSFKKITEEPISSNEFTDTATFPGTNYLYYIAGIDRSGQESPPSKSVALVLPALPEFSFLPQADTVVFLTDSIHFSCTQSDTVRDNYSYSWIVNGDIVNSKDSSFLFTDSFSAGDSVIKILLEISSSVLDTSLVHEWTLIHPKSEIKFTFDFSPKNDTTIFCGDSIQLKIVPFSENGVCQWFVSDSLDSGFSKNNYTFFAPEDTSGAARISTKILLEDTSVVHSWNISYMLPPKPILQSIFSPANDTTIVEGDSILFEANFPFQIEQDMKIEWEVNGKIDSSVQFTRFLYSTDYFSNGVDSVSIQLNTGDSVYSHTWLVTVQNVNRAPQIIAASELADSSFTLGDTLRFFISASDPDLDSLGYSWFRNGQKIEPATDSAFSWIVENEKFSADTFAVKIADADTSVDHSWIINYQLAPVDSPIVFAFFPSADSVIQMSDSLHLAVWIKNEMADSFQIQWFINGRLDTSAHDSAYFYFSQDSSFKNDTVRVAISGRDTLLSNAWIVWANSTSANTTKLQPFAWYPAQDSVFMETDSVAFGIQQAMNSSDFQWFVNSQADSSGADSIFIFHETQKVHPIDTVRVTFSIDDSLHGREWYIFHPTPQAKKTPLSVRFLPADSSLTCSGADSLKLSFKIEGIGNGIVESRWGFNHTPDSAFSDTSFCYVPNDSTARTDTISVVIFHADTTITRRWIIEAHPFVLVPAPHLTFPVEGNSISEENIFMWENDSLIDQLNFNAPENYILQLSYDNTFTKIISSDTSSKASLALSELSGFPQVIFGQPIYWRVRLLYNFSTFSEFVKSPRPFYFMPLYAKLVNFTAQKNENGSITLVWATSYEENCAGFNIHRSKFQNDNFSQINDNLIFGQRQYSFQDVTTIAGKVYYYKLEEITQNGLSKFHEIISVTAPTPENYSLSQNFPNPFNMTTSFKYQIPASQHVLIEVYNVLGRKLKTLVDARKESGFYTVDWDGIDDQGESVVSGIYFYHISANGYRMTRKMIIVR